MTEPRENSALAKASAEAVGGFDTPAVGVEEVRALMQSPRQPLLVDARRDEEFAVSHLPGAVHWHVDSGAPMPEALEKAGREGRPVLFYCSIGYRSGRAGDQFRERFPGVEAKNFEGGLFAWAEAGGELEGGDLVHPYDAEWGQLLREDLRAPLPE